MSAGTTCDAEHASTQVMPTLVGIGDISFLRAATIVAGGPSPAMTRGAGDFLVNPHSANLRLPPAGGPELPGRRVIGRRTALHEADA
jgi:hypothetical protein